MSEAMLLSSEARKKCLREIAELQEGVKLFTDKQVELRLAGAARLADFLDLYINEYEAKIVKLRAELKTIGELINDFAVWLSELTEK